MNKLEILTSLKQLVQNGTSKADIERDAQLPKNSLSSVLTGVKEMPNKWVERFGGYFERMEVKADGIQSVQTAVNTLLATGAIAGTIPYLKSEYEGQIIRLKSLGINTEGQTFEQAVNAVIFLAGEMKGERDKLLKENDGLGSEIVDLEMKVKEYGDGNIKLGKELSECRQKAGKGPSLADIMKTDNSSVGDKAGTIRKIKEAEKKKPA